MSDRSMGDIARELAERSIPTKVEFSWLGRRKALTSDEKATAAEAVGMESQSFSGSKLLLHSKQENVKTMTWLKNEIKSYWESVTLPHPETGIRLLKRSDLNDFRENMDAKASMVGEAARAMQANRQSVLDDARQRLGPAYRESDFPVDFSEAFSVSYTFPSVEPPAYLAQLAPDVYERALAATQAKFMEAANLAQQGFVEEFAKRVEEFVNALSGENAEGKPKIIRESHIGNLVEFFERFRSLKIGNLEELDTLVNRAEQAVDGVQREALRDNTSFRNRIASVMTEIHQGLEPLMVNRPSRVIRRAGTAPMAEVQQPAPVEAPSGLFGEPQVEVQS
jgi:hypothetical protein